MIFRVQGDVRIGDVAAAMERPASRWALGRTTHAATMSEQYYQCEGPVLAERKSAGKIKLSGPRQRRTKHYSAKCFHARCSHPMKSGLVFKLMKASQYHMWADEARGATCLYHLCEYWATNLIPRAAALFDDEPSERKPKPAFGGVK